VQGGGWGVGGVLKKYIPLRRKFVCAVTVTVCPVWFQFCLKSFLLLVKDPMSLESEVPLSG
jgi:hypothetical protein